MKISIIVATYNSAITLKDTFDSILRQSYSDYEVVVVDGKSEDGTLDIIRDYESRFVGKMKWVSEPDYGIYDAFNKGIAMSTGDIIGILNSDDYYTGRDVISRIAGKMADSRIDAVYGDVHYVDPKNPEKCIRYFSSRYYRPWMARLGCMVAHPSFYCRRAVYDKYGPYDLDFKVSSDFELVTRVLYVYHINAIYLNMDFVTMRTGGRSNAGFQNRLEVAGDIRNALKKHHIRSNAILRSLRYVWRLGEIIYARIIIIWMHLES